MNPSHALCICCCFDIKNLNMSDKVTTKLAVLFHASAPKLNRKSLLCIGSEAPPHPGFAIPTLPALFSSPRARKKKASIALRYRRLALVKAVSVSSSRAFFFLFLFAARLKTHARETKAMQTQSLGVAKRWKKKYIARGGGGRRTWTLTKQHVELAPSLPTVQSLSFD